MSKYFFKISLNVYKIVYGLAQCEVQKSPTDELVTLWARVSVCVLTPDDQHSEFNLKPATGS